MLEIRPSCEHCDKNLPYDSEDAMICTFECTFCKDCAIEILGKLCPNCEGDFVKRPLRSKKLISKYPSSKKRVFKPVDLIAHAKRHCKNRMSKEVEIDKHYRTYKLL